MSKLIKNKLVPKIRFSSFINDGEWIYLNGDELFDQISNKDHNSDLPILAITQEHGAIPRDKIEYNISVTDKSLESYKVVEIGDFIISLRSFQGGIEYSKYKGICSPAYIILRKKTELVDAFFKYYFKTPLFIKDLNKNLEGIRDGKMVSYKQFSDLLLPTPSPTEQQKIADCLSSLDGLIDAENQKLETLKAHKKGLMQNLFPVEGEKVPKLRFKEFENSGDWQDKKLGEIGNVLMCKRIFAEETNPNVGVPFYKIGTLGSKPDAFITRELFEEYKSKYRFPRKGEILITCSGTVGKCIIYDGEEAYFQDSNIVWIDNPTLEIVNDLLFYLLSNVNWNILNSTTITRIYNSDLLNLKIMFPKTQVEQQKIASILSSIDLHIKVVSQKIEELKLHKKGLMQGLFPNVNEVSLPNSLSLESVRN
jgi:type I restriction enzyme S subunit